MPSQDDETLIIREITSPVLLVGAPLRTLLARFLRRAMPQLRVLSHAEVPESKTIKVTSLVGGQA